MTLDVLVEPLTARERQMAYAVARGLSNRQIADEFRVTHESAHLAAGGQIPYFQRSIACARNCTSPVGRHCHSLETKTRFSGKGAQFLAAMEVPQLQRAVV